MSIRIKESAFEKFFDLNARKTFWAINKNQEFSEILGRFEKKNPKKNIHLKMFLSNSNNNTFQKTLKTLNFYFWSVFVQKQF